MNGMPLLLLLVLAGCCSADQWAIELGSHVDPYVFAQKHRMRFVDSLMPSFYIFEDKEGRQHLRDDDAIVWAERQVAQRRYPRGPHLEDDPLAPLQWHLQAERGVGPLPTAGGPTGRDIVIAIVDDGLEHRHAELAANYAGHLSWNFNGGPLGVHDPSPPPHALDNGHGTSAAAVAMAVEHNGHCGRGVAPEAKVAGIRLIAEPASDLTEAQALSKFSESIHIYSSSWGPADGPEGLDGPGRLVRELLAYNPHGRVYVWAAGNGRAEGDSCAWDGYAGNPYVNAIGAVDYDGNQAYYSEGCSNLLAVAPSSGSSMRGIITADLTGPAGYDATECTRTFGGTSSAAPLAAGIFALMLQTRPSLTWRDIRHIVAKAGGQKHSNALGFGLLKVPALLATLANHTLVAQPQRQHIGQRIVPPHADAAAPIAITLQTTNISFVENAIVRLWLSCERGRGLLSIVLRAPSGTTSVLAEPRPQDRDPSYGSDGWSFSSLTFWGEPADGTWTLTLSGCPEGALRVAGVVLGVFGS
jgi:hypothetical protein